MRKDLFSESRRLARVAKRLRRNLDLWGYEEVFLPAIEEYHEELDKGTKFAYNDEFYLIKPDLTSQLLLHLNGATDLRLFYLSEVLDGDIRGEWQCGVERIGGKDLYMQVEVLMIALTTLHALEIDDFYLDVGSLAVWDKVTAEVSEHRDDIFRGLYNRNFDIIEELPLPAEKKNEIWDLFNSRGSEVDYPKLTRVVEALESDRVFVDLGTVRPLPYYDDLVFEIYTPNCSRPIGAGGEYSYQGHQAFGFAFDLDALIEVCHADLGMERTEVMGDLRETYQEARDLVSKGKPVEVKS